MSTLWVIIPLLVLFFSAGLSLLFTGLITRWIARLAPLGALVAILVLLLKLENSGQPYLWTPLGAWSPQFGIVLVFDRISFLFLVATLIVATMTLWFSPRFLPEPKKGLPFEPLALFLLTGITGAFLTGDLFNLYVWFEVFVISSFGLFFLSQNPTSHSLALKYVIMNVIGTMLFLTAAGLIYGQTGTLNFARLSELINQEEFTNNPSIHAVLFLLTVSLLIKGSVFPFIFWLPKAYASLPTPIVTLFAACLTKVGVYVLYRMTLTFFPLGWPEGLKEILFVLAALTMVLGVLAAASQWEQKKILSFHIISQVGYMIFACAIGTEWALTAGLLFTMHNILAKSNLFLIAGVMEERFGTDDLRKQGGLMQSSRFLSFCLLIPTFSMAGLPPFFGFFAKMSVIFASLKEQMWVMTLLCLLTAFFTLYSMAKIWLESAMKAGPAQRSSKSEEFDFRKVALKTEKAAIGTLAFLSLVLGLAYAPLWNWTEQAVKTGFQLEHTKLMTGSKQP